MPEIDLRQKFLSFFEAKGHKRVPSSSLVPTDPSVLLTTAGMQQFKPYYTEPEAAWAEFGGVNVASVQKCFRTTDIDEVGDKSHLTFFEMLGNFSFGGYSKAEAIKLAHEFITQELGLEISYVSIFGGQGELLRDGKSAEIWNSLGNFEIRELGLEDVFWGPTGAAGPCGPTTEIYCKNQVGEDVEIWNIVFNEFYFPDSREALLSGKGLERLEKLSNLGIDTGMGLERLAMIVEKKEDIFDTSLLFPLVEAINCHSTKSNPRSVRIMADHLRASIFLLVDGVRPSNTDRGYILRRLIRRLIRHRQAIGLSFGLGELARLIIREYGRSYPQLEQASVSVVESLNQESDKFQLTLDRGLKEFARGTDPFTLFTTYGFPVELTEELAREEGREIDRRSFDEALRKHQEVSRVGSEKKFVGGLADTEPVTINLHTAHHLLLAALKQVLKQNIKQRGSNINQERLRLDFTFDRKLTEEEKQQVEELVNEKIAKDLKVVCREMPFGEAEKLGAEMEFGAKYGDTVSVYFIEDAKGEVFSKEFCGGPHAASTGKLGHFKIKKEESAASGIRRLKAVLE